MAALEAAYGARPLMRPTVGNLLAHMDETGVDAAVICPVATSPNQVHSINRWMVSLAGDRLIPLGALHPANPRWDEEIEFLIDHGIRGIKFQPHFQEFELLAPATLEKLEKIAGRLIVVLHAGQEIKPIAHVEPIPERLLELHRRLPELQFVAAHLGGYQMWDEVEHYLVGENIYLDTAFIFNKASDQQIARIIRNHGPEHILFASDFPWQSPSEVLDGLNRLDLSEEQRTMILAGNATRLLRL